MAAFICRMCGGILEFPDKMRICKCRTCGVVQSVPFLDNYEKETACKNAERLRREGNYDKALELIEGLIKLSPADADLYWAAVLCRYGVGFSCDMPDVTRVLAKSVLSDEDYKTALKFASMEQRKLMESAAARIDTVRRSRCESIASKKICIALACSDNFISRKIVSTISGKYDVAYVNESMVLNDSVKALIVSGNRKENFENNLVRAFINSGRLIIPVPDSVEINELSENIRKYQAVDIHKLGWESDILSCLNAYFGLSGISAPPSGSGEPMLRRIYILLDDGDFPGAQRIADKLLDKAKNNAEICAEAYLAKLLCEFKLRSETELNAFQKDYTSSENYRMAMRLGGESFRLRLRGALPRP